MGTLIVDSSALITLAGADALSLLALWPHGVATVADVYRETVEAGLAKGYPDAASIGRVFEKEVICIRNPRRTGKFSGISRTDSLVLLLAEEIADARLLVNDQTLLRKAEEIGLATQYTAEFVQELYEAGKIPRRRCDRLFEDFLSNLRYSREFIEAFLLGR